jgi:hypothetical protein
MCTSNAFENKIIHRFQTWQRDGGVPFAAGPQVYPYSNCNRSYRSPQGLQEGHMNNQSTNIQFTTTIITSTITEPLTAFPALFHHPEYISGYECGTWISVELINCNKRTFDTVRADIAEVLADPHEMNGTPYPTEWLAGYINALLLVVE